MRSLAVTTHSQSLYEVRYWQKIWQTLESVTLALASSGRVEHAAVILGHLDNFHSPGFGLEHSLRFRDMARELIEADGGHAAAKTSWCADVGRRTRHDRLAVLLRFG